MDGRRSLLPRGLALLEPILGLERPRNPVLLETGRSSIFTRPTTSRVHGLICPGVPASRPVCDSTTTPSLSSRSSFSVSSNVAWAKGWIACPNSPSGGPARRSSCRGSGPPGWPCPPTHSPRRPHRHGVRARRGTPAAAALRQVRRRRSSEKWIIDGRVNVLRRGPSRSVYYGDTRGAT